MQTRLFLSVFLPAVALCDRSIRARLETRGNRLKGKAKGANAHNPEQLPEDEAAFKVCPAHLRRKSK